MSLLAIIPARGGSKGIKDKNIINFGGKPLIFHTIEAAINSSCIERIIVSTDSKKIVNEIRNFKNIEIDLRPKDLAKDQSKVIDTVLRLIKIHDQFDEIILLQPTSPFRSEEDIKKIKLLKSRNKANSVVSVCKTHSPPELIYSFSDKNKLKPLINNQANDIRRQEFKHFFQLNGAIYLADKSFLIDKKAFISEETLGYVMPQERSIDIDSYMDLEWAKFLIGHIKK